MAILNLDDWVAIIQAAPILYIQQRNDLYELLIEVGQHGAIYPQNHKRLLIL